MKIKVSLINRESNQIDILVNAAGINLRTPAQDLTLDEYVVRAF